MNRSLSEKEGRGSSTFTELGRGLILRRQQRFALAKTQDAGQVKLKMRLEMGKASLEGL